MSVWPAVREAWVGFTTRFEGWTDYLYQDVKGLITTGMGNLVDTVPGSAEPTAMVLGLPWLRPDGARATRDEITAAWRAVRARDDLRMKGGPSYSGLTSIRLSKEALGRLIAQKFDSNDAELQRRFPAYSQWPADAQLGIHAMSWAMGPGFNYPKFAAAANTSPPDFRTMAAECSISGFIYALRNAATRLLFLNAADVQAKRADVTRLFYPGEVLIAAGGLGLGTLLILSGSAGLAWTFYANRRVQLRSAPRTPSPALPSPVAAPVTVPAPPGVPHAA